MYHEILTSLYRAFVFSTYVDSPCIASHMHLFFIGYQYFRAVVVMHTWYHYYVKFDNWIKINFFVSIIKYQKIRVKHPYLK